MAYLNSMEKSYKYIIGLFLVSILFGCEGHCDKYKNLFLENECKLILSTDYSKDSHPVSMVLKGVNPETGERCKFKDNVKSWTLYSGYMEKGDTFIKIKGQDFFKIHKKDTILTVYFGYCNKQNHFINPTNNPPTTNMKNE